MVNRQEQEKRFLEWVKARDDDWWEDEARISIWDFRVMQEFFNKDLLTTLTEFDREIKEEVLSEASDKLKSFRYISQSGADITEQVIAWDDLFDICKSQLEKEKRT